ncbi:MAG: NAD(P) transhydrogenase subunit alpha [Sciscionella sp.]|nr:NAD(P) transhydrogenase subunit alpha [Sciscionella sp.]
MTSVKVGLAQEFTPGETRVALTPEVVAKLVKSGVDVLAQAGAGERAFFSDDAYADAGARLVSADELHAAADVLVGLHPPAADVPRKGQAVLGLLQPFQNVDLINEWATRGVTVISLELLPRTLSRAQTMDALTSQANVTGYKAAVLAASSYGGYFPLLMTAAGTVKPARVLVLGAGVAGLQAIGTAKRLGAVVTGYDVRPETRDEITSLGAKFLELPAIEGSGGGGYARELTEDERKAQQDALDEQIAGFDIVITTAAVPGRRPPQLVTENALARMHPGAVLVDTAASDLGGNVAGSKPGETVLRDGVTVIGASALATTMPTAASTAYARNVSAVLEYLIKDGALTIDTEDELQSAIVIAHGGQLRNERIAAQVEKTQVDSANIEKSQTEKAQIEKEDTT